jgi:anti-sigma factor RsiW
MTMSEHVWTQEQISAYVAGGLDAQESERLENHVRECPICGETVKEARALDRGLGSLFAGVRPNPALEDRLIRSLRTTSASDVLRRGWKRNLVWGVAASVGLGIAGAGMSMIVGDGDLPFPGAVGSEWRARSQATNGLRQIGMAMHSSWGEGIASEMTPGDDRVSKFMREAKSELTRAQGALVSADPEEMAQEFRETVIGDIEGKSQSGRYLEHKPEQQYNPSSVTVSGKDGKGHNFPIQDPSQSRPPKQPPADLPPGTPPLPASSGDGTSNSFAFSPDGRSARPDEQKVLATLALPFEPNKHVPKLEFYAKGNDGKGESRDGGERGEPKGPKPGEPAPQKTEPAPNAPPAPPAPEPATARKVIRSGDIDFEIESFDSAVATVIKLVTGIKGAFVATVNSDKLANGKVKGALVVRVPPEHLDSLVLDLRKELGKGGELKGQRITSQDITKQYTDLESRLKAARTMEERLLKIIKEGKGEIKQLLEAERELGVWRTKIEEIEGELRYYNNVVSLSTLTVNLQEKEIRAAAVLNEYERVQTGIEVEDVDKAYQQALAAIAELKGRVTKSELKQLAAGQFNAALQFEVAPEQAGPMRDRLRQLGRQARLEIDRVQQPEGGTPPRDAKVKRGDTIFSVQIYNLTNVNARESVTVQVAAADVTAAYQALQDAVSKAKGRVRTAQLDENDRQNITGRLDFDVRREDEGTVQAALNAAGETVTRNVIRAAEGENVTDSKVFFRLTLSSAARLSPRETAKLAIEVPDVDATAAVIGAQVSQAKGRTVDAKVSHERSGRVAAQLIYDVPLSEASGLVERIKALGAVRMQESARDPQAPEGKFAIARINVTLGNADLIVPRDDGLWPQIRKGLAVSIQFLLLSLTWVIFGLCVVLPWALVGYGVYRIGRRFFRSPQPAAAAPAT